MWKIDTTQKGIPSVFKEYEWIALEHIYKQRNGITSKSTNDYVNAKTEISRASIIMFLKRLVGSEIISDEEASGKGGFHGVHRVLVEREDLPRKIALETLETIKSVYPGDVFIGEVLDYALDILPNSHKIR